MDKFLDIIFQLQRCLTCLLPLRTAEKKEKLEADLKALNVPTAP